MFRSKQPKVEISMPRKALEAIFDECDRYDVDETGGRIIGMYKKKGRDYQIDVLGIIGPGPNARRTPTSFFQDGEYQEHVFRRTSLARRTLLIRLRSTTFSSMLRGTAPPSLNAEKLFVVSNTIESNPLFRAARHSFPSSARRFGTLISGLDSTLPINIVSMN
jgi:hypothetical protein